jgi:hypothetical protein
MVIVIPSMAHIFYDVTEWFSVVSGPGVVMVCRVMVSVPTITQ